MKIKTKLNNKKNIEGFTLVELLIVVLIIGILSGVVLGILNTGGLRSKARDSQRVADLKKIQTALEVYFSDSRAYPASSSWIRITGSDSELSNVLQPDYINVMPLDPLQTGTDADPCNNSTNYRYNYITDATGSIYVLTAIMEVSTSNDDSQCDDLNNWTYCSGGFAAQDFCYGVENP